MRVFLSSQEIKEKIITNHKLDSIYYVIIILFLSGEQ